MFGWNMQMIKRCQQRIFKIKPQALDCAKNLCPVESIKKTEQGLRGHSLFGRSIRKDCLYSAYGQTFGM